MNDSGSAQKAPGGSGVGGGAVSGEQATAFATPAPRPATPAQGERPSRVDWTGHEVAERYKVLRRLGEGGMGTVYEAEHLHLKKRVAFKVIHPELARHEELLLRFKREALATGQLDHPHIASAIDFGELPGSGAGAFIVMPLVRGHSLQDEVDRGGAFELRRAALLGSQIADALSAAHTMGIVHRDLKPDNVLVELRGDGSEAAKVLDFGVASLAGHGGSGGSIEARPLTQAGTILGTPGYMSPEQASAGEIDHRTDIYALGVILWELVRGERLFDGDDITAIFAKQFNNVPPALELGSGAAPRELGELVSKMLSWDKNVRPSSAADVRDTLRRIAELPQGTLRMQAHGPAAGLQRHIPYAVAAVSLLVAVLVIALDGDESGAAEQAPQAATVAPEPEPQPEPKAAKKPERERPAVAKPEPRVEAGEKPVASEVKEAQETLLESSRRDARKAAARTVLRNASAVPRYVAILADFELASACGERKKLIGQIGELGDPRALPALRRISDTPRRGCGLLRLNDCLACVRRELDETIGSLDRIGR
jgi:tRNA A-37 threonylcarbamoyl transferase component Bud32